MFFKLIQKSVIANGSTCKITVKKLLNVFDLFDTQQSDEIFSDDDQIGNSNILTAFNPFFLKNVHRVRLLKLVLPVTKVLIFFWGSFFNIYDHLPVRIAG